MRKNTFIRIEHSKRVLEIMAGFYYLSRVWL